MCECVHLHICTLRLKFYHFFYFFAQARLENILFLLRFLYPTNFNVWHNDKIYSQLLYKKEISLEILCQLVPIS